MSTNPSLRPWLLALAAAAALALILYHVGPFSQDAAPARDGAGVGKTAPRAALGALQQALPGLVVHAEPRSLPADLSFTGPQGPVAMRALAGRWTLVNFWATWCAPCVEELPTLDRLQAAVGGERFTVTLISLDSMPREKVVAALRGYGVSRLDTLVDENLAAMGALSIPGLPTTLLLDPAGREVARLVGPAEWNAPAVQAALRQLIGDRREAGQG